MTASVAPISRIDRITAHILLMAPLGWLIATGAATLGEILPSVAARRAMGYGALPYSYGETFSRILMSGAALPYLLAIVLGSAVLCLVREEQRRPWSMNGLVVRIALWTFLVQYVAQGFFYFTLQFAAVASWFAAFVVTLTATGLFVVTTVLTLPIRTRLCALVAR